MAHTSWPSNTKPRVSYSDTLVPALGNEGEVSYAIAESSRGLGYGTAALVHACNRLVETSTVYQVLAITASANVASRRLLERASFVLGQEEVKMFQGREQVVSRYCLRAPGTRAVT